MVKSKKILELLEFFKNYSLCMHYSSVRVVECVESNESNKFFVFGTREELCLIYCLMAHRLDASIFVLLKDGFLEFCSCD